MAPCLGELQKARLKNSIKCRVYFRLALLDSFDHESRAGESNTVFPSRLKTQKRRFQIPRDWRAFSKNSVLMRKNAAFSNFSHEVRIGP